MQSDIFFTFTRRSISLRDTTDNYSNDFCFIWYPVDDKFRSFLGFIYLYLEHFEQDTRRIMLLAPTWTPLHRRLELHLVIREA